MNNVRAIEELNKRELEAGIPLSASWHTDWSDTAYIYIGGLPYELSEGDIITIFSQFGEPVHVNLVRDKDTGKSKGFAFLKYEDQRSTNLAVDNLGGTNILGRIIRVDHTRYKPKDGELEEGATPNPEFRGSDEDEDSGRYSKQRKSKDREGRKPPLREMLKEEIELQALIRDHDEDDPMKGYLIKQKQEEVELALRKQRKAKSSRHRHGSENKRDHKHQSHKHRSRSRERPKRRRSRSNDRRHRTKSPEEPTFAYEKEKEGRRDRDRDRERDRDEQGKRGGDRDRDRGHGDGRHGSRRDRRQHGD